ncbi:cytidine deaminase-like protein [Hypoxylon crocopeplum]|nr:cytidine deaminase-like protein [Hypoxylon crocopeplum]
MAGHKMSGYAASLWQALFASFIQLFSRIFHFSSTTDETQNPQQQPSTPSSTRNPHSSLSLLTQPSHIPTSQPRQDGYFDDLEQGLDSSSQDDDKMKSKKRNGQKRGGKKGNGPKSGPNASSTGPLNGITNSPTTNQSPAPFPGSHGFGPAGVTPVANQGDTKPNSYHAEGQQPLGYQRGTGDQGSSPSRPPTDGKKENPRLPKNPPSTSQSQLSALTPLVVENQAQTQKTGTRSYHATTTSTPSSKLETVESCVQVEEIDAGIDRLTLDDIPGVKQRRKPDLAAATVVPKPLVAPVPIVVALPITDRPAGPRSTLSASDLPGLIEPKTEEERIEREYHLTFMREALAMGDLALSTNETPVGCVLVYRGRIIAKGMNATNNTRNGTRHAEFMAVSALLSRKVTGSVEKVNADPALDDACWEDADPKDGHLYPYGQKFHPAPVVNRAIISECVLYVTVEPCVMCASLLRQMGIKKVYFGAVNDKFGGTGGVFKIHMNSKPVARPVSRPYQNGYGPQDIERIVKGKATPAPREKDDGDGGNVEPGYPVEGGYLRDDAVSLLRRFYVQENGRAPQPRKKEGRAARLYALENQNPKDGGNMSESSDSAVLRDKLVDAEVADKLADAEVVDELTDAKLPADDVETVSTTDGAPSV